MHRHSARPHPFHRTARTLTRAVVLALATAGTIRAQSPDSLPSAWEFRVTSGAFVGTGTQRESLTDGALSAVQVSWLLRPTLAVVGSLSWARSRDLLDANSAKLDLFTTDIGVERRPEHRYFDGALSTFVGGGLGVRSYHYRSLDFTARHNIAGYLATGGELAVRRVALRLEVRDYLSGFKSLTTGAGTDSRNDLSFALGLRLLPAKRTAP